VDEEIRAPRERRLAARRRQIARRRRATAGALLIVVAGALGAVVAGSGGHGSMPDRTPSSIAAGHAPATRPARTPGHRTVVARKPAPHAPFAVGVLTLRLVDHSRTVHLANGVVEPRTLVTTVRYPALGKPSAGDRPGAAPAVLSGPFPLIVFGHGFAVTPGLYGRLLRAWAAAGYVVAAPVFPAGNANAPGGPDEQDLPNQPGDMKFVITRMLAASAERKGPLTTLIDPREIAVSGQSDGGDTALAVAYDPRYRDPRVRAAVILSGAEIPFISSFQIGAGGPPLLATQGTADTVNLPSTTAAFYDTAPAPKFLLLLAGASHLPPYTDGQPQLSVVERVAIAFLDHYLKRSAAALTRMERAGNVPGIAALDAHP
jgi:alpha-beta hydrolase superfamily lysophospholipase